MSDIGEVVIQTLVFKESNLPQTVKELQQRLENLDYAIDDSRDSREAAEFMQERRIISMTLRAIKTEFAPGYFD